MNALRCAALAAFGLLSAVPPAAAGPATGRHFEVGTDARLDLAGIVQVLSDDPLVSDVPSPRLVAVRTGLEPHRQHRAVRLFRELRAGGFSHDALPRVVLHLSPPPALVPLAPLPEDLIRRAGGQARLDAWLEALRDLSREPDVRRLLSDGEPSPATARATTAVASQLQPIVSLLGSRIAAPRIVLGPLVHRGSFGPHATPGSAFTIVLGPVGSRAGVLDYGDAPLADDHLLPWIRSATDALAPSADSLARASACYRGVEPDLRRGGVSSWPEAWNEHVARAVVIAARGLALEERRPLVQQGVEAGYVLLEPLVEILIDREPQETLGDLYPRLFDVALRRAALREVIVVDPRIELMSVAQLLGDHFLVARDMSPYRRDALEWFEDFRDAPAVRLLRARGATGFSFDAVPKAFAHLTPPPALDLRRDVPADIVARAGGPEALVEIAGALRDFHRESQFDAFFRAHAGTHSAVVSRVAGPAGEAIEILRDYAGEDLHDIRIVLGMLLHDGGFAMPGHDEVPTTAFLGPTGVAGGLPDFGDVRRIGPLVWHELGHTFVNPLTARHHERVDDMQAMFEPIRARMTENAYPDWPTAVNEHVVRALEVRLTARLLGETAADELLRDHQRRGFAYLPAVAASLREYEANREAHPTLTAYYPKLLDDLAGAATRAD